MQDSDIFHSFSYYFCSNFGNYLRVSDKSTQVITGKLFSWKQVLKKDSFCDFAEEPTHWPINIRNTLTNDSLLDEYIMVSFFLLKFTHVQYSDIIRFMVYHNRHR